MCAPRPLAVLALLGLLLGGLAMTAPRPAAAQDGACFAETTQCVRGRFLDYWEQHGGLARNGFPLGGERRELLEDGNVYTVQYFERVRLELHPENQAPYDVLVGQFGQRIFAETGLSFRGAVAPRPGLTYFPATGHNVADDFRAYWNANGGLAQFGYPLSEELRETIDGRGYVVQYFERARFERHPENAARYTILLGQFGRRILAETDLLAEPNAFGYVGPGPFGYLYITNETVRQVLRAPVARAEHLDGVIQEFEHGRMVSLAGGSAGEVAIVALCTCGAPADRAGQWFAFADTFAAGQEPGGGPAPVAGRYLPKRGFGQVWRENSVVRECLGYATTPDEVRVPVTIQAFSDGRMLTTGVDNTIDVLPASEKYGFASGAYGFFLRFLRR